MARKRKQLRIGFDIDGVLANFVQGYEDLIIEITQKNLFPEHRPLPPVWDWPQYYGYTNEEIREVWKQIDEHPFFWSRLGVLSGARHLPLVANGSHDVYFITHRTRGLDVKRQTERWLLAHGVVTPTVLLAEESKGGIVAGLGLDYFIEDRLDNAVEISQTAPDCQVFLLDCPYNQGEVGKAIRVLTVSEALGKIFGGVLVVS